MVTKLASLFTQLGEQASQTLNSFRDPPKFQAGCDGVALLIKELIIRATHDKDEQEAIHRFWLAAVGDGSKEDVLGARCKLYCVLYAHGGGEAGHGIERVARTALREVMKGVAHMQSPKNTPRLALVS